jgi:mono/diheme cytochrome c family protein
MNTLAALLGMVFALFGGSGETTSDRQAEAASATDTRAVEAWWAHRAAPSPDPVDPETPRAAEANEVIEEYCVRCHNERRLRGNFSLEGFDAAEPESEAEVAERMIRKLRAGMMPPPGADRPPEQELDALATTLETRIDSAARGAPRPGTRTFQRLNQAEYARTVREILGLEIDPEAYLPPDTKSANFDNIADVQMLSPTLMDAYLGAAAEIARLAVGDPDAMASSSTYKIPRLASQYEHVEGTPYGTRGGKAVTHNFPADGLYSFDVLLHSIPTGQLFGSKARDERIEVSVDGERVALLEVDRWMSQADPRGMALSSEPVQITAGPHTVAVAFLPKAEGPVRDIIEPIGHSLADTQIGSAYGITTYPHIREFSVNGPTEVTGVSSTPSRELIFQCRPTAPEEERPCAESIIRRLGTEAYRRSLTDEDVADLMRFYEEGRAEGGFETGVRTAIQAILASPHFLFRMEEPTGVSDVPGAVRLSQIDLASRLSYFLWATPPDEELRTVAEEGRLLDDGVLRSQVERMLADPRAEALGSRFAAQWLRLPDIEKVHPDALMFSNFDEQLAELMVHETELFFNELVENDGSLMELLHADYTYVNERLAQHYGIDGVAGEHFRRVAYPSDERRGVLGHGSILTLTSHATRTSPVLRGKWIMEVLLGSPPPPPPPNVPELEATEEGAEGGKTLTVKELMAMHRANPSCASCHNVIDPIGLALEHFDVTGRYRIKDRRALVDASGTLYDGSALNSATDLIEALEARPEPFVRTFTENLMAYALGRRVEYYDMPTIRSITHEAAENDYRMSSFIMGVLESPAFQMKSVETATDSDDRQ